MLKTCYVARNICCGYIKMFPSFATWKTVFPASKYVSVIKQKHTLLLGTMFSMRQNWETSEKDVTAANVSGNMFPCFGRALVVSVLVVRVSYLKGVPVGFWVF